MAKLDDLGQRHLAALAELRKIRAQLVPAILAERARGETIMGLTQRSGYTSPTTIQSILNSAPDKGAERKAS
jgi:hypothetical protein